MPVSPGVTRGQALERMANCWAVRDGRVLEREGEAACLWLRIGSVQSISRVQLLLTPWTEAHQATLSITNTRSLLTLMSMSRWCHPTTSSSVDPFSSHLQSFPASGSFQMSQLFALGGQSIGISASTSVLTMNIQDWFPLGWTVWISFQSKGLKSFLLHHSSKALSFLYSPSLTSIHDHWKNHNLN